MKNRPILFSAPMVIAILNGSKSQTRRVVKPQPEAEHGGEPYWFVGGYRAWEYRATDDVLRKGGNVLACPYGQPGDRLWVRETSRAHELTDKEAEDDTYGVIERLGLEDPPYGLDGVIYAADNAFREIKNTQEASERWMKMNAYRGARGATVPAIHMPSWASRITLEVTRVRVERLQDISEADAMAEGIERSHEYPPCWKRGKLHGDQNTVSITGFPVLAYRSIWEEINGHESWTANPWVWVVEFRRAA
jgi:hypothetical protein